MTIPLSRTRAVAGLPALVAVVALSACSGGSSAAPTSTAAATIATTTTSASTTTTTAATSATVPSTTAATTTTVPAIPRQPLTGEPLGDGEQAILRPALAVKIDNHSAARRNHSGLAVADIVFEEIVEADITRFAAVFHSRDSDVVGPIRSGRSQDIDLLQSFGSPLFAWSGGNPGVTKLIAESSLVDLNAVRGGEGYYRGAGTRPHNLYNSTQRLWEQTPIFHPAVPPPQQFGYLEPGQTFEGDPVGAVSLRMRSIDVVWTWDAEAGRFLRSQEGAPHVDALHGRIGAENVIVLSTWYRPSAIDARSPEAQTTTESAPLWVFSNGKMVEGRWYRHDASEPIRLVDENFRPIALTPGTTWVELAEAEFTGDAGSPMTEIEILPPG